MSRKGPLICFNFMGSEMCFQMVIPLATARIGATPFLITKQPVAAATVPKGSYYPAQVNWLGWQEKQPKEKAKPEAIVYDYLK